MSTFFISDTHFDHKNICKFSNRPFNSVQEMNEVMIENWNKLVKPNDIVYHLGDFSFGNYDQVNKTLWALNGKKHLILGNHDKTIRGYLGILCGAMHVLEGASEYKEIVLQSQSVILAHYGHRVWNRSHHGSIHLYGHSHGTLPPLGRSVDVGVDAPFVIPRVKQEDYRPLHEDEIITYMKTRTFEAVDRHGEK